MKSPMTHDGVSRWARCGAMISIMIAGRLALAAPPQPANPEPPPAKEEPAAQTAPTTSTSAVAPAAPVASVMSKPGDTEADPVETPEEKAARYAKAKEHFEKATALRKKNDLAAALAEYLASRRVQPTWGATSAAAWCLRALFRYDEALDMVDVLLRDYEKTLPAEPKNDAQRMMIELRGLVGTIDITDAEFDAAVTIDGRSRGTFPSPNPYRVAAGTHIVRVYKEGYDPFETSVDVAGNQVQTIVARLRKLEVDESGRLRVTDSANRILDVVIDGNIVGKTPWEGPLRDGVHTVHLEGEGSWGTQPVTVRVERGRTEMLGVSSEQLEAEVLVKPSPAGAMVAIDGVSVGRGVWQGKLRKGKHRIEVAAEGYVLYVKDVSLDKEARETLTVKLDRDPLSPLWKDNRGRLYVEAAVGPGIVPTFGGDIVDDCSGTCSSGVGVGVKASARGGYRFPSGFFLGVDVGYFYARQKVSGRQTTLTPAGLAAELGTVDDTLSLRGVLVGGAAGIRIGKKTPLSIRLGAGALLAGTFRDRRTGQFVTNPRQVGSTQLPAQTYAFDTTQYETPLLVYVSPEVQMGFPLAERLHLQVGLEAMVLIAPASNIPTWSPEASRIDAGSSGQAAFPAQTLMGSTQVFIMPAASLRYEF